MQVELWEIPPRGTEIDFLRSRQRLIPLNVDGPQSQGDFKFGRFFRWGPTQTFGEEGEGMPSVDVSQNSNFCKFSLAN